MRPKGENLNWETHEQWNIEVLNKIITLLADEEATRRDAVIIADKLRSYVSERNDHALVTYPVAFPSQSTEGNSAESVGNAESSCSTLASPE